MGLEWVLTGLSLLGSWLNIHKKISSWYVWAFANAGWVACFVNKGMLAEATLFVVYFFLSIYGMVKWRNMDKDAGKGDTSP